jgi:hypothetical protein
MDAAPILPRIAELLNHLHVDAILVGNAAAALQGSPVATLSIQFEVRSSTRPVRRLAAIANELGATLERPFAGSRNLRMALPSGVSVEFLTTHRRRRYSECSLKGVPVRIAAEPRRRPVVDLDMVRRWQALPPEKRTNFLRVRIGLRGSCL